MQTNAKKIELDKLIFLLNDEDKTACIIDNKNPIGDIIIPRAVKYGRQEYIITSIAERSLTNSQIRSIQFPPDSELQTIESNAISFHSIESFSIPPKVSKIKRDWCSGALHLVKVTLMPGNPYFINYEDKCIFGKSDLNREDFDVLIFANRDVEDVFIPPNITIIAPYAFSHCIFNKIFIPHQVTQICEQAFAWCDNLRQIQIPEDSNLQIIEKKAFANSPIESLSIPSSISELQKGWCYSLPYLMNITIYKRKQQKIVYFNNAFILGKSEPKSDIYDILLFAHRNIRNPIIPSFIKYIDPYSFDSCILLDSIHFLPDSKLENIGKFSFSESSINMISIPSSVTTICKNAFFRCFNLKTIEFPVNSELKTIEKNAFYSSAIENLTIPSKVSELSEGWCSTTPYLTNINVMPNNKKFMNLNNQMILGKSDIKNDEYDVLLFASRNIKKAIIPSFIKVIGPYAFDTCKQIKIVELNPDSELQVIGKNAFSSSSIKNIKIPFNVTLIDEQAFSDCDMLKAVEIDLNSRLQIIGENAFSCSSINKISISNNVKQICKSAFLCCDLLDIVDIQPNSQLQKIDEISFSKSQIDSIYIPQNVNWIGPRAFSSCYYLQIVEIDENSNIQAINESIFDDCYDLIIMIQPKMKNIFVFNGQENA